MIEMNIMVVLRILSIPLGYTEKSAPWVPRILHEAQKEHREHFAQYVLNKFKNGQSNSNEEVINAVNGELDKLKKQDSKEVDL